MNQVVIKVIGNYSYQTSRCLGQGVYGKVYEGMERETKEKVAIKKIDLATFTNDKYLQNAIFSEIYLLKRFNHPNIVKFKDVLSSKNSLYIITQYCKNGDLKEFIKRKRFREDEVFEVMRQIMNGFSELIRQKIIHRDLKPANILINEGVYKIGDFGFAKYVDNFGSQMLKSCVGSPIYMAPQILQRSQYTTKCDIWSLGIIFYQMIFGCPPWKARDQSQLLRGIKTIPISHIIKRQSLTTKASDFLKKTLAYSEDDRIGWSELFEFFATKIQKNIEIKTQPKVQLKNETPEAKTYSSNKDRNKITSGSIWSTPSNGNIKHPPINNSNSNSNNSNKLQVGSGSTTIASSDRRKSQIPHHNSQIQTIQTVRDFCIYYSFFNVELFLKYNFIKHHVGNTDSFGKLLLILCMTVKYKSTYCLSLINISSNRGSGDRLMEQLHKKIKVEHESYEDVYNDITLHLEREGTFKKAKQQISILMGRSDIINEEKIDKCESQIVKIAHENAQILSDEVRRRGKTIKDFTLVEILDFVLDVLSLALGKNKALQELKQSAIKSEDEDLKDYLSKVITKVDKLTANI